MAWRAGQRKNLPERSHSLGMQEGYLRRKAMADKIRFEIIL
jgi:hypothetical protein